MNKIIRLGLVLALPLMLAFGATGLRAEHDAATSSQETLEQTIHNYLLSHPDVIIEVLDILRAQQATREEEQAGASLVSRQDAIYDDPTSPVGGNPDGDVTIVEFFDYFCGFCKRVMPDLVQAMKEDPGVRFIFKEFPILGPDSVIVARVALAAHRQSPKNYEQLHVAMMTSRGRLNEAKAFTIAAGFGYDVDRIRNDMNSPEIDRILEDNRELAEELGIQGTPGFVIGDQIIPGAVDLETLRQLIAEARQS